MVSNIGESVYISLFVIKTCCYLAAVDFVLVTYEQKPIVYIENNSYQSGNNRRRMSNERIMTKSNQKLVIHFICSSR